MPDGNGVRLAQVEAPLRNRPGFWRFASEGTWWPDIEDGEFRGKRFDFRTVRGEGSYSGHARSVARLYFGNDSSMVPGASAIDLYSATDWVEGVLRNGSSFFPGQMAARVVNQSWVGSTGSPQYDSEMLRRLDWSVNADRSIHVVGVGNGDSSPPLLGNAFNVISVGRSDGHHGAGTLAIDSVYREGRTMPLIVAPLDTTSAATPVVAAAAALLVHSARRYPSFSSGAVRTLDGALVRDGERPEVIKAILMAGASRYFDIGDGAERNGYRATVQRRSDNGLDRRFGAGQLNVLNSYAILSGGEQHSAEDGGTRNGAIKAFGYDFDTEFGGMSGSNEVANYHFKADARHRWLTATLAWNARIATATHVTFESNALLYDLDLELFDDTDVKRVAVSASWAENTETLWTALVPGHHYRLVVKIGDDGEDRFLWRYALAWRIGPVESASAEH